MEAVQRCPQCGEEEIVLRECQECNRPFCVDNCLGATDPETGEYFCLQCVEEGRVEIIAEDQAVS